MDEERKDCIIVIKINDNGAVEVNLSGRHINKREVLRVIKAIKVEHRERIRQYRLNKHLQTEQESKKNVIKLGKILIKEIEYE